MKITALNAIKPTSIAMNNRMGSPRGTNAPSGLQVPVPLNGPLLGGPQNQASEQEERPKDMTYQLI